MNNKGHLYLTNDDMVIQSGLATHDALVELGKHQQKKESEAARELEIREELLDKIVTFKQSLETIKTLRKTEHNWNTVEILCYRKEEIDTYMECVDKYLEILHSEKTETATKNNRLHEDNAELVKENKEAHREYEERERYWTDRTTKLRAKCMRKNLTIKIQHGILITVAISAFMMYCVGYSNFISLLHITLYFILYYPLYYTYRCIHSAIYCTQYCVCYSYWYTYYGYLYMYSGYYLVYRETSNIVASVVCYLGYCK